MSSWLWREASACRNRTELMFPEDNDALGVARAKAVCADCPVKAQCLEFALANGERWGVWGGKVWLERRVLARHTCGTPDSYLNGCRCRPCARAFSRKRAAEREVKRLLVAVAETMRHATVV